MCHVAVLASLLRYLCILALLPLGERPLDRERQSGVGTVRELEGLEWSTGQVGRADVVAETTDLALRVIGGVLPCDDAQFVTTAIRLGRDTDELQALRKQLAACRDTSGVFDMHGYARDFVVLLQRMAERHRHGIAPAPLE